MRFGRMLKGINPVSVATDYGMAIFVIIAVVLMFVAFFYVLAWIDSDFAWW